jgi:hypothetical protein
MEAMTRLELAEVLHELAGLVERPATEPGRAAESFQAWLEAHGFVHGDQFERWTLAGGDGVYVEVKGSPMRRGAVTAEGRASDRGVVFHVYFVDPARQVLGLTEVPPSLADLVDAMNGGALKREIDEAVDWDPELAV